MIPSSSYHRAGLQPLTHRCGAGQTCLDIQVMGTAPSPSPSPSLPLHNRFRSKVIGYLICFSHNLPSVSVAHLGGTVVPVSCKVGAEPLASWHCQIQVYPISTFTSALYPCYSASAVSILNWSFPTTFAAPEFVCSPLTKGSFLPPLGDRPMEANLFGKPATSYLQILPEHPSNPFL